MEGEHPWQVGGSAEGRDLYWPAMGSEEGGLNGRKCKQALKERNGGDSGGCSTCYQGLPEGVNVSSNGLLRIVSLPKIVN